MLGPKHGHKTLMPIPHALASEESPFYLFGIGKSEQMLAPVVQRRFGAKNNQGPAFTPAGSGDVKGGPFARKPFRLMAMNVTSLFSRVAALCALSLNAALISETALIEGQSSNTGRAFSPRPCKKLGAALSGELLFLVLVFHLERASPTLSLLGRRSSSLNLKVAAGLVSS